MKSNKCTLLIFTLFFVHQTSGHLSCRLTSSGGQRGDIDIDGDLPQTLIGPPGKMGPQGPPGDVLKCDCSRFEDMETKIRNLEEKLRSVGSM